MLLFSYVLNYGYICGGRLIVKMKYKIQSFTQFKVVIFREYMVHIFPTPATDNNIRRLRKKNS